MTTLTQRASVKSAPPRRTIGFVTACSIVIANIIGTGIFTSLGFQLNDIQSGFPLLMLWVIGGIAALCGALCYGELSAALPRSGGEYHFLSKIYHPALGFMAGFVSATVGFAAPVALAAMAFGQYFNGVFDAGSPVVLSFVVVWIVTAFHLRNLRVGSAFQNVSTLVKLLLIGALIGAGFFVPSNQPISFLPASGDKAAMLSGPFAVALVYVMYSYSGWNASAYISSEIKRPEKNVPRSLLAGTGVVIVIYVLLNAIFLATTPAQELKGQLEIALIAGKHIFGDNGGRFAGAIICLGLVAAISSMRQGVDDVISPACVRPRFKETLSCPNRMPTTSSRWRAACLPTKACSMPSVTSACATTAIRANFCCRARARRNWSRRRTFWSTRSLRSRCAPRHIVYSPSG